MNKISKLLISVLAISTLLVGCGGSKEMGEDSSKPAETSKDKVVEKVPGIGDVTEVNGERILNTTLENARKRSEEIITNYIETLKSNSKIMVNYGGKVNISDESIIMRATEDTEKITDVNSDTTSEIKYDFRKYNGKNTFDFQTELKVTITKDKFTVNDNSLVQKHLELLNKNDVKFNIDDLITLVNETIPKVPVGHYISKDLPIEEAEGMEQSLIRIHIGQNNNKTYEIDVIYAKRNLYLKD